MFGLERYITVPSLVRGLNFVLTNLKNSIDSALSAIEKTNGKLTEIEGKVEDLTEKQDSEKRVSCIATQRTTNAGAAATISASDESTAVAGTNNVRRLNNFETNSSDYFEMENSGLANARIKIKKPGIYRVMGNATFGRTGNSYLFVQADIASSGTSIRRIDGGQFNVNTTAGGAGSSLNMTVVTELEITVETVLRLYQFITVRTASFSYGQFFIDAGSFNDTCSLTVELIREN